MAENNLSHIFLKDSKSAIPFSQSVGGGPPNIPQRDRKVHSEYLTKQFELVWEEQTEGKNKRIAASIPTKDGYYIQFKGGYFSDIDPQNGHVDPLVGFISKN